MSHDAHQQEGDREDWYRFDAPHLEFYYDLNKEKVAAETGVEPEFSFERPSFDNPEQRRSRLETPLDVQEAQADQINDEVEQALFELQQEEAAAWGQRAPGDPPTGHGSTRPAHAAPARLVVPAGMEGIDEEAGDAMDVDDVAAASVAMAAHDQENHVPPVARPAVSENPVRRLSFGALTTSQAVRPMSPLPSPPRRSPRPAAPVPSFRDAGDEEPPMSSPRPPAPVREPSLAPPSPPREDDRMQDATPHRAPHPTWRVSWDDMGTGPHHEPPNTATRLRTNSVRNGRMRTGAGRVPVAAPLPLPLPLEASPGDGVETLQGELRPVEIAQPVPAALPAVVTIPSAHVPVAKPTKASAAATAGKKATGVTARPPTVSTASAPKARPVSAAPQRPFTRQQAQKSDTTGPATSSAAVQARPTSARDRAQSVQVGRPTTASKVTAPKPVTQQPKPAPAKAPTVAASSPNLRTSQRASKALPAPRMTTEEATFLKAKQEGEEALRRLRERNARYKTILSQAPAPPTGAAVPAVVTVTHAQEPLLATAARGPMRREQRVHDREAIEAQLQAQRQMQEAARLERLAQSMQTSGGAGAHGEAHRPHAPTVPQSPQLKTARRARPSMLLPREEEELALIRSHHWEALPLDPRVLEGEPAPVLPRAPVTQAVAPELKTERRARDRAVSAERTRDGAGDVPRPGSVGGGANPKTFEVAFGRTVSRLSGELSLGATNMSVGVASRGVGVSERKTAVALRSARSTGRMDVTHPTPSGAGRASSLMSQPPVFSTGRKRYRDGEAMDCEDEGGAGAGTVSQGRRAAKRASVEPTPNPTATHGNPQPSTQQQQGFTIGSVGVSGALAAKPPRSAIKKKDRRRTTFLADIGENVVLMQGPALRVAPAPQGEGHENGGAATARERASRRRAAAAELQNKLNALETAQGPAAGGVSQVPRVRNFR